MTFTSRQYTILVYQFKNGQLITELYFDLWILVEMAVFRERLFTSFALISTNFIRKFDLFDTSSNILSQFCIHFFQICGQQLLVVWKICEFWKLPALHSLISWTTNTVHCLIWKTVCSVQALQLHGNTRIWMTLTLTTFGQRWRRSFWKTSPVIPLRASHRPACKTQFIWPRKTFWRLSNR